jgi:hypothetical protein
MAVGIRRIRDLPSRRVPSKVIADHWQSLRRNRCPLLRVHKQQPPAIRHHGNAAAFGRKSQSADFIVADAAGQKHSRCRERQRAMSQAEKVHGSFHRMDGRGLSGAQHK